jgi:omega-amidase
MQLLCLQYDIVWENKAANHSKVSAMLDAARPEPGSLLLLPESFATGFSMNLSAITEKHSPQTHDFLSAMAAAWRICILAGLTSTGSDGRGRNEAVLFSPDGQELGRYQKMHLFGLGGESESFTAGDAPIVISWNDFKVSPFICYDLRFPEVFRHAMRKGANLFAVVANWPASRVHHWISLLQARAIENQAYVAGVNRCGNDPKLFYPGRSLIVDPTGRIVADAGDKECIIGVRPSLDLVANTRRDFPFLEDARADYLPEK